MTPSNRSVLVGLAVLALTARAHAVDVRVGAQTVGQGYQLITANGEVLKRSRLNQYLSLDIHDMTGDKTNLLSFVSSFRFDSDFGFQDREKTNIEQYKNNALAMMYAYLQLHDLAGAIDMRLGRQLIVDDMDFTMMDGLRFTYRTPFHFAFEVMAGVEVKNAGFLQEISHTQLEVDGDGGFDGDLDEDVGIVVGASVFLNDLKNHHGKLGWRSILNEDGDPDAERIFLSYHYRILPQLHVAAAASWDFVINNFSDVRASIRSPQIAQLLDIELSYWRLVPTFEGSSIFNVFSIEPMNDIDLRFRFHVTQGASVYVGGYLRLFGNDPDPNDEFQDGDVKDWGVRAGGRLKFGTRGFIGLDASHQQGYGEMTVVDVEGGYDFFDHRFGLEGRLTTVVYADDVQERWNATSFGAQIGVTYRIPTSARFHLLSEVNTNRFQSVQFRMIGLVDLDFWL